MDFLVRLTTLISPYQSVLVGYSGGVDSALLAVVARRTLGRNRAVAALGLSPSVSAEQRAQARRIAAQFDIRLIEIETREFEDPRYIQNTTDRCYFCKRELWSKLAAEAVAMGLAVVVDGTNADDLTGHRPGGRAGAEFKIGSPLAEAGLTKSDVRDAARSLGIPIWDAPAAPCLSSRVLFGLEVTPARVADVEAGEAILRRFGIEGDLRVRHRGDEARVEVPISELDAVRAQGPAIGGQLLDLGFERVTLDVGGYRRGSLLIEESHAVELLAERPLSPGPSPRCGEGNI